MSRQKREAAETGPLPEVPAAPPSTETRSAKDVTLDRRIGWALFLFGAVLLLALMPALGLSVNMISLFAFLLVLGIVGLGNAGSLASSILVGTIQTIWS